MRYLTGIVVVVLVMIGISLAPQAQPKSGSFVFRDMDGNVFVAQVTNSTVTEKAVFQGDILTTKWSPDGKHIGVASACQLILIDSTGGNPKIVSAKNTCAGGEASWSPDSKHVAFIQRLEGPNESLWISDLEGNAYELTQQPTRIYNVEWIDEKTIRFSVNDQIFVMWKQMRDENSALVLPELNSYEFKEMTQTFDINQTDGQPLFYTQQSFTPHFGARDPIDSSLMEVLLKGEGIPFEEVRIYETKRDPSGEYTLYSLAVSPELEEDGSGRTPIMLLVDSHDTLLWKSIKTQMPEWKTK